MTCYNDRAARNYAHSEGLLQDHDDHCEKEFNSIISNLKEDPDYELFGSHITDFAEEVLEGAEVDILVFLATTNIDLPPEIESLSEKLRDLIYKEIENG